MPELNRNLGRGHHGLTLFHQTIGNWGDVTMLMPAKKPVLPKPSSLSKPAVPPKRTVLPNMSGPRSVAVAAARARMDEFGREIFDLWFTGKAPNPPIAVIFDNPRWTAYMKANKELERQIDRHLTKKAGQFRDQLFSPRPGLVEEALNARRQLSCGPDLPDAAHKVRDYFNRPRRGQSPMWNERYETSFHAQIGTDGYWTGYDLLHGSNRYTGDFEINGTVSMTMTPDARMEVKFTNTTMTFNDFVNPNPKYRADTVFGELVTRAAEDQGFTPKDYILRIRWRETAPLIYTVPLNPGTQDAGTSRLSRGVDHYRW